MKLLYISLFLLSSLFASAQWNADVAVNLEVASTEAGPMQTLSTSDGKTWIAFYETVSGGYQMKAQLLDVNGNKLLGPNGVLVSNQPSGSATYVFNICLDANENLVVAFQYQIAGANNAVVCKVTQTGTLPWGLNGVVLGLGLAPFPALLSNGDIVVAWNFTTTNTLNMQKVTSAGTLDWTPAREILVGTTKTTAGQIVGTSEGTFTMVFQRKGTGVSGTLFVQRYNSGGEPIGAAPVQLSNQTSSTTRYYPMQAEGDTTYLGYYVSSGSRFNSFLQRIDPFVTLPWGINGSAFDTLQTGTYPYQQTTNMAFTPGSPYVWQVCSFSNSGQSQYGIYVQKFAKLTGAKQFGISAKELYPITTAFDQQIGTLGLYNDAPMFMQYDGNYKIYASRLDTAGNFVWSGNRVNLSTTTAGGSTPKGRFGFTTVRNGQAVAVWNENRGSGARAYAQNITFAGTSGPALPVTLSLFHGKKNGKNVDLEWTTMTEVNNQGFYIEKSADGRSFSTLLFVPSKAINGTNNGRLTYTLTDTKPFVGNNYYRLKQVDKDGKSVYSDIVYLKFSLSDAPMILGIYPNPVKQVLNLAIQTGTSSKLSIIITDITGKTVLQQTLANTLSIVNLNVANLAKGMYTIKMVDGSNEMSSQLFIKD